MRIAVMLLHTTQILMQLSTLTVIYTIVDYDTTLQGSRV